jgi:hypothetical protein
VKKQPLMPFGKHRGEPIARVAGYDRAYLRWLLEQPWLEGWLREQITLALDPPRPKRKRKRKKTRRPPMDPVLRDAFAISDWEAAWWKPDPEEA